MKKWGFRNESPNKKESPIIRQVTINWFEGGMVDPLFVLSMDDPKQNATLFLTPVSNIVSYALSSGTLGFALHGSSFSEPFSDWWKFFNSQSDSFM